VAVALSGLDPHRDGRVFSTNAAAGLFTVPAAAHEFAFRPIFA
jgi:hypothetical protein